MASIMQNRFSRISLRAAVLAAAFAAVIFALPAAHSFGATGRAAAKSSATPPSLPFTLLHSFRGRDGGASPEASLLRDASGNLYGTAAFGGGSKCGYQFGCGTVFEIDATGQFRVLYVFSGGADGGQPKSNLIEDAAGNLYGATFEGRNNAGVVFELSSSGQETPLYTFIGGLDGANPLGGLVWDSAGNLYGTTVTGGYYGYGTVYKLTPQSNGGWIESVLHSFQYSPDGAYPLASLVRDSAGNLYGTASAGGDAGMFCQCGVLFKVNAAGNESTLYAFTGGADGGYPQANLILDSAGNLYGTTFAGGGGSCDLTGASGCGVVFKVDTTGKETVLYSFTGEADGADPTAGLIRDSAGNLYGTTFYGGLAGCGEYSAGCGVIFKLDPVGNETVLFTSTGGQGGAHPNAGLIGDGAGNAYGTATTGGAVGDGTVFRITP